MCNMTGNNAINNKICIVVKKKNPLKLPLKVENIIKTLLAHCLYKESGNTVLH